jgi:hypothetical protein
MCFCEKFWVIHYENVIASILHIILVIFATCTLPIPKIPEKDREKFNEEKFNEFLFRGKIVNSQ